MSTTSTKMAAAQEPLRTGNRFTDFNKETLAHWAKEQYPLYILIMLLIVAGLSTDAFFTSRNLTNLVLQVSVIGIVALAQFLIVLTGGIDISVGSVVGLAGVVCTLAFGGISVPLAILIAVALGALVGLLNGYFVAFRGLEPFIVTLGMLSLARGLVYALTEGVPVQPQAEDFRKIATTTVLGFPLIGVLWLVLAAAVWFVVRRTVFGRRIFALGSNADAAYASGVPVKRTLLTVYIIAGMMVGFAGFLLASRVGVGTPTAGTLYELDSIAAVVIGGASLRGGKGRVLGVVFGTLIFGIITNLLVLLNVSTFLQDAFRGGLILLAVVMTTIHFKSRRTKAATS